MSRLTLRFESFLPLITLFELLAELLGLSSYKSFQALNVASLVIRRFNQTKVQSSDWSSTPGPELVRALLIAVLNSAKPFPCQSRI